jgi:hypothetical protein
MNTHLLQSILNGRCSQFAASIFQDIAQVFCWRYFDNGPSGGGVYHHHVGSHVLLTEIVFFWPVIVIWIVGERRWQCHRLPARCRDQAVMSGTNIRISTSRTGT